MDWQDEGIVLTVKAHGENAVLTSLLTRNQGNIRGLVHGGNSRKSRPLWQPGNIARIEWRARLAEQLGTITGELDTPYAAGFVGAPAALPYLQSLTSLLTSTLPEGHPYPNLYSKTVALLDNLTGSDSAARYARYELQLLAELGFALDLTCCAATGQVHDLVYVSPRTGRAISREAAQGYEDRLLPLPQFLVIPAKAGTQSHIPQSKDIANALTLTGFFLERWVFQSSTHPALKTRERLLLNTRQMAA